MKRVVARERVHSHQGLVHDRDALHVGGGRREEYESEEHLRRNMLLLLTKLMKEDRRRRQDAAPGGPAPEAAVLGEVCAFGGGGFEGRVRFLGGGGVQLSSELGASCFLPPSLPWVNTQGSFWGEGVKSKPAVF